jgi:ABC-type multidrug transport system fused ATPase/permease subunit
MPTRRTAPSSGPEFRDPAGQKLAIVGPSGAGKSTIARLLFRFYDVTEGRITINGQDIRSVTQDSLRRAIGVVPQDTVLFNDTIRYNIAYGRPDATDAEIERAVRMAHLDGFIARAAPGAGDPGGRAGLKVSGGEKQRIAIARVLLKDPPILVLDEATSSLDSHGEKVILEALNEVAERRTTLAIAHRLSTIVDADRIIVLDQGASWSRAIMPRCWPPAAPMRNCGCTSSRSASASPPGPGRRWRIRKAWGFAIERSGGEHVFPQGHSRPGCLRP